MSSMDHARTLLAIGHTEKLGSLYSSSNQVDITYIYLRQCLINGYIAIKSGQPYPIALQEFNTANADNKLLNLGLSEFQFVYQIAQYLTEFGGTTDVDSAAYLTKFKQVINDPNTILSDRTHVLLGEFFFFHNDLASAHYSVAKLASEMNLDAVDLFVTILLRIDRPELASILVNQLLKSSADPIIPQIIEARVNMAVGDGNKIQQAIWLFEELIQTYSATSFLLTSLAACHLLHNKWTDAARLLNEAILLNNKYADAHVNLVVASAAAGHADVSTISGMWDHFPNHPFTENLATKAALFDQAAAKYLV